MRNRIKRALAAVGTTAVLGAAAAVGVVAASPASAQTVKANETFTGAGSAAAGGAISQQSCDFTGDGKDDIVTSAWMWDRDGYGSPGAAYVIPNGTPGGELDDEGSGIVRIEGPQTTAVPSAGALTGFSLSCAGDVNGDEIDDVIIGDYMDKRAYVVFGSKTAQNLSLEYLGESGFIIQGTSGRFGNSVAGVGDLNGDGRDDVAVLDSTAGIAHIVKGRYDIGTVTISDEDDDDLIGTVTGSSARKVSYMAPAGDVNGDGRPDLALGGYTARPKAITDDPDDKTTAHGIAWVLTKPAGNIDLEEGFSGFTINGPARGKDRLGTSISAAGDIDDDGFDDLVIGAYGTGGATGGIAVVRGSDSKADVDTDPAAGSGSATASGAASTAQQPAAKTADSTVYSSDTDRGWWIDADGAGYAVSAITPQCKGQSGTLVFGSDGEAAAWALDTRALTRPLIAIAEVDDKLVDTITGDDDRLGRGIGVISAYGKLGGPQMVVGAENIGDIGYVSIADVPAQGALDGSDSACPTDGPDPSDTPDPGDTAEPTDTARPTATGSTGGNPGTTSPADPGGQDDDGGDGSADSDPNAAPDGPDGSLPVTGATIGWLAAAAALLIATGVAIVVIARRRNQ